MAGELVGCREALGIVGTVNAKDRGAVVCQEESGKGACISTIVSTAVPPCI